jgi:hypothetical protein
LSFLGHTKDSLWSIDLFRCEPILSKSHWVLVVIDQFTRRVIGSGVHVGNVDGIALLTVVLVSLVNPALAVVTSHQPNYASGENKENSRSVSKGCFKIINRHYTRNGIQVWQQLIEPVWNVTHGSYPQLIWTFGPCGPCCTYSNDRANNVACYVTLRITGAFLSVRLAVPTIAVVSYLFNGGRGPTQLALLLGDTNKQDG